MSPPEWWEIGRSTAKSPDQIAMPNDRLRHTSPNLKYCAQQGQLMPVSSSNVKILKIFPSYTLQSAEKIPDENFVFIYT